MLTSDWSRRPRARGALPQHERHGGAAAEAPRHEEDLRPPLDRGRGGAGGSRLLL